MTTISPGIKSQQITPVTWQAFGYDDLVLNYIGDSTVTTGNRDDRIVIKYVFNGGTGRFPDNSRTKLAGAHYSAEFLAASGIVNATVATGGGMIL